MIDLLTIGDSSIDLYMKIDSESGLAESNDTESPKICFFHGSKIPVEHFETSIAGNSVNVAVGCKTLGLNTAVYSELGQDANAEEIIDGLEKLNINTEFCIMNEGKPTNVHAVVVYGGERTIFSYHDKRDYKIRDWEKPKWIYYTSMGPGFEEFQKELVQYIKNNPDIGIAFNPGSVHMKKGVEAFKNFLEVTHVLFVNKEEAINIVGKEMSIEELHKSINSMGPKISVITNSKEGATAYDGENFIHSDIYSDERNVVDKTGAGDSFSSGFLSALFYGKNIREALSWGIINSGNLIKEIGAIKGLSDRETIEKIIKEKQI